MRDGFFSTTTVRTDAKTRAEVQSALSAAYDMDVHTLTSEPVSYQHAVTSGTDFAVGRAQFTGELVGESLPLPFLCIVQLRSGKQHVTAGNRSFSRETSTPFLFPRHTRKHVRWHHTDLEQIVLRPTAVDQELAQLNLPPLHQMELREDPEPATVPLWEAAATYARAASAMPLFGDSPLAQQTAFRTLVAGFLTTFTTEVSESRGMTSRIRETPATVRTALAFIDAHAGEPLTVADIALAAGISSRGLQAAFSRHVGYSPMHALRDARLHRAHTDLINAHPEAGDTVTMIAARWGFTNVTRFSKHYRTLYGHFPDATLRSH